MKKYTYVSLFCGCGGFDVGAIKAGFTPVYAADNDAVAIDTYINNIWSGAKVEDLRNVKIPYGMKDIDMVVGGPPCQGFSTAGPSKKDDPRNKLWENYLYFIEKIHPRVFVLENVPSFKHQFPQFAKALNLQTNNRYHLEMRRLVAQFYGVPQFRNRHFIVGIRKDLGNSCPWPMPTEPEEFKFKKVFKTVKTLQESLQDLGPAQEVSNQKGDGNLDHVYLPLTEKDAGIAMNIPNGGSLESIPPHLRPEQYKNRPIKNITEAGWLRYYRKPSTFLAGRTVIASIRPIYATILAPDVNVVKTNGKYSWEPILEKEFTTSAGLYISPVPQRRLTIRECARLQTFPDNFKFSGKMLEKHKQIGNAIPCELSQRICNSIIQFFENGYKSDEKRQMSLF